MDPNDFLHFARKLAGTTPSGAAEYRSAISRSYYAAYLVIVSFVKDFARLEPMGGSDKHSTIKLSLMGCTDTDVKKLGMKLDTLHTQRRTADYDMASLRAESQATALAACKQSEEIINEIDAITKSASKLATIVAEIQSWAALAGRGRMRTV